LKKQHRETAQNRGAGSTPTSPSAIRLSSAAEILCILPDASIDDRLIRPAVRRNPRWLSRAAIRRRTDPQQHAELPLYKVCVLR
jgi:hypothetical protein